MLVATIRIADVNNLTLVTFFSSSIQTSQFLMRSLQSPVHVLVTSAIFSVSEQFVTSLQLAPLVHYLYYSTLKTWWLQFIVLVPSQNPVYSPPSTSRTLLSVPSLRLPSPPTLSRYYSPYTGLKFENALNTKSFPQYTSFSASSSPFSHLNPYDLHLWS